MLSQQSEIEIDREIAKYPPEQKQAAVMAALTIAQREKGWLAEETLAYVARRLGIPAIRVAEVATFYSMYDLQPVGRHKICLCTNISCMLRGADAKPVGVGTPGEICIAGRTTRRLGPGGTCSCGRGWRWQGARV